MKAVFLIVFLLCAPAFGGELLKVKTAGGAILKEAPDGNAPQKGPRIPLGASVEKLEDAPRYFKVKTSGGLDGWSFKGNFEPTGQEAPATGVTVTKETLLARKDILQIVIVDVEVGDATLFFCPEDNGTRDVILIDTGVDDSGRILDELKNRLGTPLPPKPITRFVVTHFHKDHEGHAPQIIPLAQMVYDHGDNMTNGYYSVAVQQPGVNRKTMALTYTEQFSGGVRFDCVAANGATDFDKPNKPGKPSKSDENVNSIAMVISYGDFDYFTGGDLTKKCEQVLKDGIKNCDVYHVNHHGGETSSVKEFIDKLDPEVSIASNGREYDHPRKVVAERLGAIGKFFHTNANPQSKAFKATDRRYVADDNFTSLSDEDSEGAKGTIRIFVDPPAGKYYVIAPNLPLEEGTFNIEP